MAKDESTLTVKRVINADAETIFEALTNQEIIKKWFFASADSGWSASVENNPKKGGSYKIDMHSPKDTYSMREFTRRLFPQRRSCLHGTLTW